MRMFTVHDTAIVSDDLTLNKVKIVLVLCFLLKYCILNK